MRTRAASFPGMKIAEIFGVSEGPLWEQMRRNILHVNGADHARLRSLVNPALSPRAVERYRPVMRGFLEELLARGGARGRRERRMAVLPLRVRGGVRQAVSVADDRERDGRADRGRAEAAPLVELDPAAVRRGEHGERARGDRAGGGGVLRVRGRRWWRRAGRIPGDDLISTLIAARTRPTRRAAVAMWSASTSCSTCWRAAWTRARASWRTRSGCWPNTPSSGRAAGRPGAGRGGGRGGAAV